MAMRAGWMALGLAMLAAPALAQGLPGLGGGSGGGSGLPGLGGIPGLGAQNETPEQKRAFCGRVASAAMRCGPTLDVTALSSCLIRTLPPQDSLRVAQVANNSRGNASGLLSDCGVGLGR
jgi:hypothetical protein